MKIQKLFKINMRKKASIRNKLNFFIYILDFILFVQVLINIF